ncbi:unnamed protein product [Chironomus riparius]|uniref:Uncharacterized protein n=1 Tax=Chironomus riparius TaxID=315576 RepID=A0A9N9WZY3_9DIPT|nr:unnamed protein product [Chironomus riparius]
MSDKVKIYRETLKLPENAENRKNYLKNQRNYNKKYIMKQKSDPEKAKSFKSKRNEQLRRCRIRKKQEKQKREVDGGFISKVAKSRALTKAEMALPKSLDKKMIILKELNARYIGEPIPETKTQHNRLGTKETEVLAINFLSSDIVSRQLPGIKDYIIVKTAGSKTKIQKRIMTMPLKEAYDEFKKEYTSQKMSFSKFARMRPDHVVLFSQSKQISCLCIYCTNLDFIVISLLPFFTCPVSLKELMCKISCHVENFDCASGLCTECLNVSSVVMDLLKPNILDHLVNYQQWETVDKVVQKVTHALIINDLILLLEEKMQKFKMHYFLVKIQLALFRDLKQNLDNNSACLIVDYAENYNCRSQDEISSAYFGRRQISLFTSVVYVGNEDPISIVIANDCISHNKEQVWFYIKFIVDFIQSLFDDIRTVNVFSDGACSQFKNRFNISNIMFAKEDFNVVDMK